MDADKKQKVMESLLKGRPIEDIAQEDWCKLSIDNVWSVVREAGFQQKQRELYEEQASGEVKVQVKRGLDKLLKDAPDELKTLLQADFTPPSVKHGIVVTLLKQAGMLAGDEERLPMWFMPAEEARRLTDALVRAERDIAERKAKDNGGDGRKRSVVTQPAGTVQEGE